MSLVAAKVEKSRRRSQKAVYYYRKDGKHKHQSQIEK